MAKTILLITLISIIIFIAYSFYKKPTPTGVTTIDIKGNEFKLEVARTIHQKNKGLMNRPSLGEKEGMIFVSSMEIPQAFWMKNTLIPLDMIFLDKDGKVLNIETALPEPGVSDLQLKLYKSIAPAKYVIELNKGTSTKIGLVPGDIINLPKL